MKVIAFERDDGGVSVSYPAEGARLALSVTLAGGNVLGDGATPRAVDTFLRGWPITGAVARWAESEDQFVARVRDKVIPAGALAFIVDDSAIPQDRTFRDAWAIQGGAVAVDMVKALEIGKDLVRERRKPLLAALDVAYIRADEAGDAATKAKIVARKQALRDATSANAILTAATPEALLAAIDQVLG